MVKTVTELIEKLSVFDRGTPVAIIAPENTVGGFDIDRVEYDGEYIKIYAVGA